MKRPTFEDWWEKLQNIAELTDEKEKFVQVARYWLRSGFHAQDEYITHLEKRIADARPIIKDLIDVYEADELVVWAHDNAEKGIGWLNEQ